MPGATLILESHQYLFNYLGRRFSSDIRVHLIEKPQHARREFFRYLLGGDKSLVTRENLLKYLNKLETDMRAILSNHSPFFLDVSLPSNKAGTGGRAR